MNPNRINPDEIKPKKKKSIAETLQKVFFFIFGCAIFSFAVIADQPLGSTDKVYAQSMKQYCQPYLGQISFAKCQQRYQQAASMLGFEQKKQEASVQKALDFSLNERPLASSNDKTRAYRAIHKSVSPVFGHSYAEDKHRIIYLSPQMTNVEQISVAIRHGMYQLNPNLPPSFFDHQVLSIKRLVADLTPVKLPVYWAPSYPDHVYKSVDTKGFALYRYQLKEVLEYLPSGHNSRPFVATQRTSYQRHGQSQDRNVTMERLSHSPFVNKDSARQEYKLTAHKRLGVFDGIESFSRAGFVAPRGGRTDPQKSRILVKARKVTLVSSVFYLLVKFNRDGSVELAMPYQNKDKHLVIKQIETFLPMETQTKDGWFAQQKGFDPSQVDADDWRHHLATTEVKGKARYVCRFNTSEGQMLYGVVSKISDGNYVCTGGKEIFVKNSKGEVKPLRSLQNNFDWLSLVHRENADRIVKDNWQRPLCHLTDHDNYGVGYVNEDGQCAQDFNVLWVNGDNWRFTSGWALYQYQ